ncbi:MAG: family 43 glycosylhydrolase [Halanaerobiales bacterium]
MKNNPVIWADYPDPDIIRVEGTYYMVSTTMHFMPGCVILRSYDLINWEVATHVYDILEDTPAQRLEGEREIYGQGMWAASFRYHKGKFYVCFAANDTHKTYLYTADNINGPWEKRYIEGFYHDCSLLFDDNGKNYIIYGNDEIHLTELEDDLSGPKAGGLDRIILREKEEVHLGYEGAHLYKINGKYYAFFIHITAAAGRRTQACFMADSLENEFTGGDVFNDDMGYHNSGIAQGGIVDTPEGDWYAMLFQDHGAVGRIPVLIPFHWKNDFPVFPDKAPEYIQTTSTNPEYKYFPLVGNDDFKYKADEDNVDEDKSIKLKDFWEWNHIPDSALWSVTEKPGTYRIKSAKISPNIVYTVNTLTQRAMGPASEAIVTLDGSRLRNGDYAGISCFMSTYGLIALTKDNGQYFLVMAGRDTDDKTMFSNEIDMKPGKEYERVPVKSSIVRLKAYGNFVDNIDECKFYYQEDNSDKYSDYWIKLGITYKMYYKLDMFCGCRFALFLFSTEETGGIADFSKFEYKVLKNQI